MTKIIQLYTFVIIFLRKFVQNLTLKLEIHSLSQLSETNLSKTKFLLTSFQLIPTKFLVYSNFHNFLLSTNSINIFTTSTTSRKPGFHKGAMQVGCSPL